MWAEDWGDQEEFIPADSRQQPNLTNRFTGCKVGMSGEIAVFWCNVIADLVKDKKLCLKEQDSLTECLIKGAD